eukprot:TRINITY_DN4173_c0_g1_i1.p1 TRINITY_DN4173_c0_g1~~TRINITY_DN4173_c0_g1_i1.p1  ORF type:complete len:1033 (+),score=168.47 TRINITY_DN4173_c0_g1_i1:77-3100(+)
MAAADSGGHLYAQPLRVLTRHFGSTVGLAGAQLMQQSSTLAQSRPAVSLQELRHRGRKRRSVHSGHRKHAKQLPPLHGAVAALDSPSADDGQQRADTLRPTWDGAGIAAASGVQEWSLAPRTEECGIDHLVRSLERLIPRVQRDGFPDKWQAVGEWIDKYDDSRDIRNVTTHCASVLGIVLDPVESAPSTAEADMWPPPRGPSPPRRHRGRERRGTLLKSPGKGRVASAAVLLDVLFTLLVKCSPSLRSVVREVRSTLLLSIFAGTSARPDECVPVPDFTATEFPRSDFEEAKGTYRTTRQPYSGLVDELMSKLGIAANELEAGEQKSERLLAVMDRGMAFWKGQLKQCIVRVWSNHLKTQRRIQTLEKQLNEADESRKKLDLSLKRALQTIRDLKDSHANEVAFLRQEVQTEKTQRAAAEAQLKELENEQDALLRNARDGGAKREVELQDQLERASKERDDLMLLCRDVTVHCLEGPPKQSAQLCRVQAATAGALKGQSLGASIVPWLNTVTAAAEGVADKSQYAVKSLSDTYRLLEPYILAMRFMAPDVITKAVADAALQPQTVQDRAHKVLDAARQLGLELPFGAEALTRANSVREHAFFCAALFGRYCDPTIGSTCSLANFPAVPRAGEHPMWPKKSDPGTALKWRERMDKAWISLQRRREAGAAMRNLAEAMALGDGDSVSALSSVEEQQRAMYLGAVPMDGPIPELDDVLPAEPRRQVMQAIQEVVLTNYRALRGIFRFYATSDSRHIDEQLSPDEVWKLLGDCKISSGKDSRAGVTRNQSDDVFRRAAGQKSMLGPTEFVRLLVRLAAVRVKGSMAVADKLQSFVERHVLPNANYSDTGDFRAQVYSNEVQSVLLSQRDLCVACFRSYCKSSRSWLSGKGGDKRMTIDEFSQLATDLTLPDSVLTQQSVRQIFLKLVSTDDAAEGQLAECAQNGLMYDQFVECLCCLAAFKSPAPYLPLSRRVARFFDIWFVPILQDASRFKKVHDELLLLQKQQAGGQR